MNLQFKTILSDKEIEILNFKDLSENEEITSTQCSIDWRVEPIIESFGIKFWNISMLKFHCKVEIKDNETLKERCVMFDDNSDNYTLEMVTENYKMKNDFVISDIVIDRKNKTAKAYISYK